MKKIQEIIFETFSFGYGNNDYLSDLGNPDIKDKMGATAFQPDTVDVRPGLVNEITKEDVKKLKIYRNQIEEAINQLVEDGSMLYTTDNIVGDISKPTYRQGDFSVFEDLEYSRADEPTKDKYVIDKENINLEGVGDKYLHRKNPGRFPEDEFSDFENKYQKGFFDRNSIVVDEDDPALGQITIIKNPASLSGFKKHKYIGTRGIVDKRGNIYINHGENINHQYMIEMLSDLNLIEYKDSWWTTFPDDFITVEWSDEDGAFYLGESTSRDIKSETIQPFLDAAKQKNPNFKFINKIIRDDEMYLSERNVSYMDGSVGVDVKKQCRLGGLGSTSKACNQGDIKNLEFKKINENTEITKLADLPFKNDILSLGGNIYSVGGSVRDEIIGKESKDLDIIVTGIPIDDLEKILSEYGRVDLVGKSFGVLKFKPKGSNEEIDVTIPRTEKPTGGGGHKDFEIKSDHTLSIEDDLFRRDLTINAIAKDLYGNYVDPYGGINDLKRGIIREVNPNAFSDDPLRMLRAVQFSARFGFKIDKKTLNLIRENAVNIKREPKERLVTELEKIVEKGSPLKGAYELKNTHLFKHIFDSDVRIDQTLPWDKVNDLGEYIYLLTKDIGKPSRIYQEKLQSGVSDTYRLLLALEKSEESTEDKKKNRLLVHKMYLLYPNVLNSKILPNNLKSAITDLNSPNYPIRIKDLEVRGGDLISLGYKQNEKLGNMLYELLIGIYMNKLKNNKTELLNYAKKRLEST